MFRNLKTIFSSKKETPVMTEIQEPVIDQILPEQSKVAPTSAVPSQLTTRPVEPDQLLESNVAPEPVNTRPVESDQVLESNVAPEPVNTVSPTPKVADVKLDLPDPLIDITDVDGLTPLVAPSISDVASADSESKNAEINRDLFDSDQLLFAPETVGWLSTEEQELLFSALLLFYSPEQSVLDVGCGRADFYGYCYQLFGQYIPYKGIDYNPNMLSIADQKFPGVITEATDILNSSSEEKFDWVVGSGLFNLNDHPDMEAYAKSVIQKMYDKSNIGVAFNLLTGVPEYLSDDDKAQLVVHDPSFWLDYLIQTYTKVICRADYLSGDATFFIFK